MVQILRLYISEVCGFQILEHSKFMLSSRLKDYQTNSNVGCYNSSPLIRKFRPRNLNRKVKTNIPNHEKKCG